ncbi:hypothetical protein [Lactococcus lactis]|uniref:hypothetical protein n=1 Tax=Lactococcus lactis TaxID=1358 RepID=UPI00240FED11|nr:hypothetical protein [Lactococcus lactis]
MLISIHDRTLERVGFLSNDDSESPDFKDDNFHRYLAQGTSTFDFTVNKIKNGVVQDYVQLLNEHAYFSFQYEGEDFLFDSVIVEEDDDKITFNCLTLNLEMRNEQVKELKNTAAHNIQWYFDQMGLINFAKITLGINEVSSYTRAINYDGEDTKLSRLISVIQNFDGEFEFVTKLKRDGTLDNITLNIYKKNDNGDIQGVGQNRNDVLLSFGDNISGVSRKVEKAQIFNSIYVTGKDGLSWKDSAWSVTNSEGKEEFYKRAGESYAKAPLSAQMFPSQLQSSSGDIFTNKNEATEYTTVNAMWGYALSQLKQYAYPLISYEVTATSNLTVSSTGDGTPLHIGDTVRIQDKNFIDSDGNVGLFLSARVSELEISFTNPTSNKITFSNYIKLKSEVSDDLTARMQEIINANTPYRSDITSTNGLQFKNGTGTTTLGAHIYFGSDDKETIADSYEWSKDGTIVANAQTITVDASGVADKAVYSFKATVAGKVVANQSVTITNVDDGTNGRSVTNVSQKWRLTTTTATPTQAWSDAGWLTTQPTTTATNKYLWSITRTTFNLAPLTQDVIEQKAVYGDKGDKGDTGNDGRAGKDGVGINSTTITYAISSSGTVTPTTGWTSQAPTLVKGQYLWTKTVWNYSDGTSESGYTVSYIAKDGNNGNDGIAGKDGVGLINTTLRYAKSKDGVNKPEGRIVASFTDKFIPARSIIDNLIMTGKQVHLEQGKTYILSAETNGVFTNVHNVEQSNNNATIWIVNPSFSTWDIISDTNTAIGTKYTHNRPTGDYEIRINSYVIDNSIWIKNIVFEDGTWTPNIPVANPGEYLWTRTTWFYSDGTNETGFSVAKMGEQGPKGDRGDDGIAGKDGVGVRSTNIAYGLSVSETVSPTDWSQIPPDLVKGQWFWTKTQWTYTDSSSETGFQKTYIAKDGNDGTDGIAGKDGVGLVNTTIEYLKHTDGQVAPNAKYYSSFNWNNLTLSQHLEHDYVSDLTLINNGKQVKYTDLDVGEIVTDRTGELFQIKEIFGTEGDSRNPGYINLYPSIGKWSKDIPTVNPGEYLWTKTVWTYTDNTSETGYSVAMMGLKGDKGDPGNTGPEGPAGSNGDPGKIVSDTEPTTRFKGLTWKYSGTTDLTASDGTVIKPNTEYYYNGTHWMINFVEANQIKVNDLSAISGTYTNGSIKNVTTDGSVTSTILIEKKHILFTFSDSSQNTTNTLELDSQQGYANTFADSNSGRTRTVQANFQGFFTSDTDGPSAQLTPYGVYVTNGLQTTTVSLGSGINATLAKIGQMCQISINSNSSNVPAGNGVALSGNIPAGWRPAIGTPFEVMMYSGTTFQRPLHITIGTDGKLSIVNASASSYWCFGGTVYMLA